MNTTRQVAHRVDPERRARRAAPAEVADAARHLGLTGSMVTLTPSPKPTPSNVVSLNSGRPNVGEVGPAGQVVAGHEVHGAGGEDAHAVELAAAAQHLGEAHVVAGRAAQTAAAHRRRRRRQCAAPMAS